MGIFEIPVCAFKGLVSFGADHTDINVFLVTAETRQSYGFSKHPHTHI